jgi:hypothetical protein
MRSLQKLALSCIPLTLAACSTSHEFRVAAVGDTEASELAEVSAPGGTPGSPAGLIPSGPLGVGSPGGAPGVGSSPTGTSAPPAPLIVASGNVLLGSAGQITTGGPVTAAAGVVNGTVSGVLLTTSQTVVRLADGPSVLVDGVGATLGDLVSIDLGQGQVVGGAKSLVGNTVPGVSATAGKVLGAVSGNGAASGAGGRVASGGAPTLPGNVGKVLAPVTGVTSVVQPAIPPTPALPVLF